MSWSAACAAISSRRRTNEPPRDFSPGGAGVRTVFNPVPLYMGERLRELPVDVAVAAFTTETPARVSQILDLLFNAQPFDSEFTRGLYYTNN